MHGKGKKILASLAALAMTFSLFAACSASYTSDPLDPADTTAEQVASNGGFVVETGDYVYFINGVESYTADNTYGTPVKGTLMRIAKSDLAAGNYAETDIVVPQLLVSQDYTSGFYIYGDRVYYASPTTARNPDGDVENSYIDFKSSALDGSETMSGYYVRMEDNTTVYRYVQDEDGTVYLLYVDSSASEIHSYNTETDTDTTLVSGYGSYALNADDLTDSNVFYTMPVVSSVNYNESSPTEESYQQVYRVNAFVTESPYEMDLSEDYTDPDSGEVLDYVNLGTLVFDGIGKSNQPTPFNHDIEGVTPYYTNGVTYTLVKYTNGGLYYTNTENGSGNTAIIYRLPEAELDAALSAGTWNSVSGNANNAVGAESDVNERVAVGTDEASGSALFFEYEGAQYYLYASGSEIVRVRVDESATAYKGETVSIATGLSSSTDEDSGATTSNVVFLFIDNGYLYFTQGSGDLYRINCVGAQSDYRNIGRTEEFRVTEYAGVTYNTSWYTPEIVDGYLFFANAGDYAEDYVYVAANPATNADLKVRNDRYDDVQEVLADISEVYSNAGNAAEYYYYTQDADILSDPDYAEQYTEEDLEVFNAFVNCEKYGNAFDASVLKEGDESWNYRAYFMNAVGRVSDGDADTIDESLKSDLLVSDTAETSSDGWTWEWAALFVPIGVVVIAGAVVAVILIKKKKRRSAK